MAQLRIPLLPLIAFVATLLPFHLSDSAKPQWMTYTVLFQSFSCSEFLYCFCPEIVAQRETSLALTPSKQLSMNFLDGKTRNPLLLLLQVVLSGYLSWSASPTQKDMAISTRRMKPMEAFFPARQSQWWKPIRTTMPCSKPTMRPETLSGSSETMFSSPTIL